MVISSASLKAGVRAALLQLLATYFDDDVGSGGGAGGRSYGWLSTATFEILHLSFEIFY